MTLEHAVSYMEEVVRISSNWHTMGRNSEKVAKSQNRCPDSIKVQFLCHLRCTEKTKYVLETVEAILQELLINIVINSYFE